MLLVQVQRSLLRVQVLKYRFVITSPLRLTPELSNGLIARDGLTPVTKFEWSRPVFRTLRLNQAHARNTPNMASIPVLLPRRNS